ncbi:MAG: LuxR C-terminal-related transcriptional regulator [Bacillota bacterium]
MLLKSLSHREKEVVRLMAEGQTITEIAREINISCETVKTHRENIYRKLGVTKKSNCLKKARELGFFEE